MSDASEEVSLLQQSKRRILGHMREHEKEPTAVVDLAWLAENMISEAGALIKIEKRLIKLLQNESFRDWERAIRRRDFVAVYKVPKAMEWIHYAEMSLIQTMLFGYDPGKELRAEAFRQRTKFMAKAVEYIELAVSELVE